MGTMEPVFEARALVRGAASATLATQREGQPFASLVTPAAAPDLTPLLWLSTLSEHTRQLMAEPRCALLFAGAPAEANPQTTPRVTLTGVAEPVPEAEASPLKARWLVRHPYAALYADFADFALWRVRVGGALLVGGFARATRIRAGDLLPDPAAVAAVAAAEAGILDHMNADHAEAVAAIARALPGGRAAEGSPWRMVALDVDGADLACGDAVRRLRFSRPVGDPGGVRDELVRAANAARGGQV
jgi:putative heme iron utilization protein